VQVVGAEGGFLCERGNGMGRIVIKLGDITEENVDVIVNAANTALRGGGGVDGAIHRAGGPSIMAACREIGGCRAGSAVITTAGELKAKKIIHTPGPVWKGGEKGEAELLTSCYRNCFRLAKENLLKTIAFPAISAGVYGYPIAQGAKIALCEGIRSIDDFDEVRYVCFSKRDYRVYVEVYEIMTK